MAITITGSTSNPSSSTALSNAARVNANTNPGANSTAAADDAATPATDKVTLGTQSTDAATYTDPRKVQSQTDLQAMLEESDRQAQAIIDLITPLVQQQGLTMAKVASGEQKLQIDSATIDKAKAAIADDGEFGVKQVAERILSFAKNAIGDDPSKIEEVRAAVEKGFKQAQDALGGKLPDISEKTHSAIMAEFDRWEKEGIPQGDKVTLKTDTPSSDTVAST